MTADYAAQLDAFERTFFTGDRRVALGELSTFIQGAARAPDRAAALGALVARFGHEHPGFAGFVALGAGALIEAGEPARATGLALIAPVTRALVHAGRVLGHFAEAGHDAGDGSVGVSREMLDGIAMRDPVAVQAWAAMDTWYRPAVATWTRAPDVLQTAQADAALRAAVDALGHTTETSHWLALLVETPFAARFALRFPELGTTEHVIVDGVNDLGQLCVLLSDVLREPLAKIGVTEPAAPDVVAVMRGDGPQQGDGGYSCTFHCYRAEAIDPADGLPKDGRDMWRAPGGTGTHSLPPDFLPGSLAVVDGVRTLVVVGPNAPGGMRFVRMIAATRTFDKLAARVTRAN